MSRHWDPRNTDWLSSDAYAVLSPAEKQALWRRRNALRSASSGAGGRRLPPGAKAGLILAAAACLGVGFGAYQALGPRDNVASEAAAPTAEKVETVASPAFEDPSDAEWRDRARRQDSPSTGSGRTEAEGPAVRASFSYCKWGGGTNCVVDGDTFYIGGEKVRIAEIDAPETHDYRCASELALGDRATEKLQALLNSGAVTMTSIDRDRDVYGRLLRNVSVNGQDVGDALISAGVARAYAGGRRPWCG